VSAEAAARTRLAAAQRVVVKVGSLVLAEDAGAFGRIGYDVARLVDAGRQVVLVTSGAIALGLEPLGLDDRPEDLVTLQAAAAAGQSRLMWRWMQVLEGGHARRTAQVLLTHADLESRRRYLNARSALVRLLERGVIPIVNENDTVSVDEIKLGDNDLLAAEVAGLVSADAVVLLTSADGLMTADPAVDEAAERVSFVADIDEATALAGAPSRFGTGGMQTKLRAAEVARRHGAATVIAPGRKDGALFDALSGGDVGTLIAPPEEGPAKARKRWIASTLRPAGTVVVDDGAAGALRKDASLLFIGVREVRGDFAVGDCVDIQTASGAVFARGLATVGADDAREGAGKRTPQVREVLGELCPDELIHRDDLALL
jgi:glutamate 5-kinase